MIERSDDAAAKRPNFFAELKRRNVIRMAGLYLVGAWLIVQIAETVLPIFKTPDWVLQTLVLLLALGFIPALVFSWVFELTPDGLKRDGEVKPDASVAAQTGRRMDKLILAGMVVVVAVVVADRFVFNDGGPDAPAPAAAQAGRSSLDGASPATGPATDGAAIMAEASGIAVLPFVNMSPDPENAYFADGISEELLNILAGIEGLKVASRTSAFSFKGSNTPIPEIARQLGVRHVLEGSVRKQGNQVRITAQLIDAGDDAHLWSERYDRDLVDIFQVQEEIAQAITLALEDILGTRQVAVEAPTRNMDAYQSYLQGRSRFYQRNELDQAIEDFRFAVERDPDFAEAWAFLASIYWLLGSSGYETGYERAEMVRLAGPAADRAMALNPGIPIGLAVKGQIVTDSGNPGAVAEGIRLLERAVALPSPDTTPKLWLALLWLELGHAERAMPLLESARRLDPLVGINSGALGIAHAIEGRRTEAERLALEAVELSGLPFWATIVVVDRVHDQDTAGAAELVAAMLSRLGEAFEIDRREASALLQLLQDASSRTTYLESGSEDRGHFDNASLMFDRGERAFETARTQVRRPWAILLGAWLPAMQWLREDPRYFQLMVARGRVDYWEIYGYPRGCRPVDDATGRHLDCPEVDR